MAEQEQQLLTQEIIGRIDPKKVKERVNEYLEWFSDSGNSSDYTCDFMNTRLAFNIDRFFQNKPEMGEMLQVAVPLARLIAIGRESAFVPTEQLALGMSFWVPNQNGSVSKLPPEDHVKILEAATETYRWIKRNRKAWPSWEERLNYLEDWFIDQEHAIQAGLQVTNLFNRYASLSQWFINELTADKAYRFINLITNRFTDNDVRHKVPFLITESLSIFRNPRWYKLEASGIEALGVDGKKAISRWEVGTNFSDEAEPMRQNFEVALEMEQRIPGVVRRLSNERNIYNFRRFKPKWFEAMEKMPRGTNYGVVIKANVDHNDFMMNNEWLEKLWNKMDRNGMGLQMFEVHDLTELRNVRRFLTQHFGENKPKFVTIHAHTNDITLFFGENEKFECDATTESFPRWVEEFKKFPKKIPIGVFGCSSGSEDGILQELSIKDPDHLYFGNDFFECRDMEIQPIFHKNRIALVARYEGTDDDHDAKYMWRKGRYYAGGIEMVMDELVENTDLAFRAFDVACWS